MSSVVLSELKIFEYISYDRPIIMSDVGGLTEVLDADSECLTYKADDTVELAEKIMLLINDDLLMNNIRDNARHKLKLYSNWNKQALLYEKVLLNGIR